MAVIPSVGVEIWVCLFLYGRYYPGVRLQIWVRLICVISAYSNGAVQIRVGLEFADKRPRNASLITKAAPH